jgi:hypothetical protein
MKNSFLQHPEFLDADFRGNRPADRGLPNTAEIVIRKHELLLPPEKLLNKRVLDIGSFIGQTGDWCLSNGASSYTGVEIVSEYCATANTLLSKYYSPDQYTIINQGLDDFFATNTQQYDIVFCWGVLFGHHDHVWFVNQLAQRAPHVILDSRHPKLMWNMCADQLSDEYWHALEYSIPYSEWYAGSQMAAVNASVKCTAASSSIAALNLLMEINGFSADLAVYEKLKKEIPDVFGMFRDPKKLGGRFVIEYFKNAETKKPALYDAIFKDPALWEENYVDWLAKK